MVVQCWWELTLDPVQRKRFRKSLGVGLTGREGYRKDPWRLHKHLDLANGWQEDQGPNPWEWEEDAENLPKLAEPIWPLTIGHIGADGVWALRLLVYNPSPATVRVDDVDAIAITITGRTGFQVLSWQFDDGRLTFESTEDRHSDSFIETIRLPADLRSKQKIRDELVVVFNSRITKGPPDLNVEVQAPVRSKVKLYRPSSTKIGALSRLVVRSLGGSCEKGSHDLDRAGQASPDPSDEQSQLLLRMIKPARDEYMA